MNRSRGHLLLAAMLSSLIAARVFDGVVLAPHRGMGAALLLLATYVALVVAMVSSFALIAVLRRRRSLPRARARFKRSSRR